MPVYHVPVIEPVEPLVKENGITGRNDVISQLNSAEDIIRRQSPDRIVTLGGDCLVSLIPFSYLAEKYGDKLGVLWIDAHPDIQNVEQFSNAHAHVLGLLLGHGDPELKDFVKTTIPSNNVMIAGVHNLLEHEQSFIDANNIATYSPQQVRENSEPIKDRIKSQGIEYLAIHLDLDALAPHHFRSVLFARPGRGEDDFGGVAEGELSMQEIVTLIREVTEATETVGLTIAEHLPWDAINLKAMLKELPLIGNTKT